MGTWEASGVKLGFGSFTVTWSNRGVGVRTSGPFVALLDHVTLVCGRVVSGAASGKHAVAPLVTCIRKRAKVSCSVNAF